ncbi:MAG: methylmalonyl-CoA epimerase [Candidatus Marinimicrobia bacterium]|jgi:methylmalonyl-CoA epimerase|nr:methylmalonyl-CoA epimerase [Candidatus Neomarinimicrobiota bacterium]MDP6568199.1 methylmalonyl-CoA epimerase [Candidatus Neomarinimicrobiota bacterium]MDP7025507.1 methylmalonyl-CoA epimerase [Candidatus Neomarinimicrobiota bacterium]|tara:strand:+ start:169 stop:573 length:405 start_codon:yes stop_codon:yes gene_type:complete
MKILGIEHIGIAVESLDKSAPFWREVLKISHRTTETVESEGVVTDIFDTGSGKVELLSALSEDSPVGKFLAKRGPGIHHICLQVDDIRSAIVELKAAGVELVKDEPSVGAEGYLVVFVHPRSAGGVLVELAERR